MLRLKRIPATGVSIVWRERTGPSKRLIAKGFLCSLVIHLIMLLGFQIRAKLLDGTTADPAPVVFLDADEGTIALLGGAKGADEDPRRMLTRHMHLTDEAVAASARAFSSARTLPTDGISSSTMPLPPLHTLPWSFSDENAPSRFSYRVYPLRISLHEGLRAVQLTDDGSRFVKRVTSDSIFITPSFSETHPTVEFTVDIAAATGRVVSAACIRELVDKRLQTVAQKLVKALRFEPVIQPSQPTLSGIVALRFSGTYDSISPFLEEGV